MPRWLQLTLAIALYTAIMAVVSVVAKATLPGILAWLDSRITSAGTWALLILAIGSAGIYGLWPRDAEGRMRSPLPLRR